MAGFAKVLPYASTALTIGSILGQGDAQEDMAAIRAQQQRKQAIANKAQAVQDAKNERRKAELLQSRVKALAAGSGTSLDSPDIQDTLSDIDERGDYNALAALYSGYTAADSQDYAATIAEVEGKQKRRGSRLAASGTILDSISKEYG